MKTLALALTIAGIFAAPALACVGCGALPTTDIPDAAEADAPRMSDTARAPDFRPPCIAPAWSAATAGQRCVPVDPCNAGSPTSALCACHPPETTPPAAASLGARCNPPGEPNAGICCAWFVEAPFLLLWENCGAGWTCTGNRCPVVCRD